MYNACYNIVVKVYTTTHLKSSSREATFDQPSRKTESPLITLRICKSDALNFMCKVCKPNKYWTHSFSFIDFAQNRMILDGFK